MLPPSTQFAPRDPSIDVSVIIPVFKPVHYLQGTLASIFQERTPGIEVIIIDDGSPEDVAAACGPYVSQVTLIRQANAERCVARNNGMAHAHGAYIHFLDADDQVGDAFYHRGIAAFRQHPQWDGLVVQVANIDAENQPTGSRNHTRFHGSVWPQLALAMPVPPVAYLFRREALERAGVFDPTMKLCEDWDLWARIARTGAQVHSQKRGLALYRIHSGSNSQNSRRFFDSCRRIITSSCAADGRIPVVDYAPPLDLQSAGARIAECAAMAMGAGIGRGDDAQASEFAGELLTHLGEAPWRERYAECCWFAARDLCADQEVKTPAQLAAYLAPHLDRLGANLIKHRRGRELEREIKAYIADIPARHASIEPPATRSIRAKIGAVMRRWLRPEPPVQPCS